MRDKRHIDENEPAVRRSRTCFTAKLESGLTKGLPGGAR